LVPPDVTLGAVYLVRDPRDVAISFARHMAVDLDRAIAMMADPTDTTGRSLKRLHHRLPEFRLGWSVNVASWLTAEPFTAHVVRYEDMRADPAAALAGILPVLGVTTTPAVIRAAIAATALDTLREQEVAAGGFVEWQGEGGFFGQGRVGGWRDRLTPAQVSRIEADHGPLMRRLGYLA
jgi:aryl sulfotransferase